MGNHTNHGSGLDMIDAKRRLRLVMVPFRIRQFLLSRALPDDARWRATTMGREYGRFESRVELSGRYRLALDAGHAA